MARGAERPCELAREPGLADARLADHREEPRRAGCGDVVERRGQPRELGRAADERGIGAATGVQQRAGALVDADLAGRGGASEPAGDGDDVADRRRSGTGQRGSGRDAGADREIDVVRFQLAGETGERIEQLARDVAGTGGVVLVGDGGAEDHGDPVGEQLERRAAVAPGDLLRRRVAAPDDLAQELGVERRAGAGRAHVDPDADDVASRRPRCGHAGLVAQDRALERAQLGRGVEPELVAERGAKLVVGGERVGLATAAVEREHQLAAHRLAQRVLRHERVQLRDQLAVAAEVEPGVDPRADRLEPLLLEPLGDRHGERLEADVLERRAAPERECLGEPRVGDRRLATGERVVAGPGQPAEPLRVELAVRQPVAVRAELHRVLAERAAKP